MRSQIGNTRMLMCGSIVYGKPVRSDLGPLHENAPYGVNSVTPDIRSPLRFIPANFLSTSNIASNMIDPEYTSRGALIVKAMQEGLAIMRLRYRAEAGEGEEGRKFLLSHTILLSGIKYWNEIPAGMFAWCEQNLKAVPFVYDQSTTSEMQKVELPAYQARDINWYDELSRHRQIQLGSAFQAIRRNVGWMVSGTVAEGEKQHPGSLIAADLDVVASLPSKFPLRVNDKDKFILNLGLEPELTPGAISYFPKHRGSAIEAPDLDALRVAIIRSKSEDLPEAEEGAPENLFDSLNRRIGKDPIPLRIDTSKVPY